MQHKHSSAQRGTDAVVDIGRLADLPAVLVAIPAGGEVPLDDICLKLGALFESDVAAIDAVSEADVVALNVFGLDEHTCSTKLDPAWLRTAMRDGKPVFVDAAALPAELFDRGVRTGVCVPFPDSGVVLSFLRTTERPFTGLDVELIEIVGRYLYLVLRRVQRANQLRQLAEHSVRIGMCRTEADALEVAVEAVSPLLDADAASIAVVTDKGATTAAHRGFDADADAWAGPVVAGVADRVLGEGRPLRSKDLRCGLPERADWPVRAGLIVPVEVDGNVVALLAAYRFNVRAFNADDEYVLTLLAGQLAALAVNARMVQRLERRRREAETLRTLAAGLNSTLSAAEVAQRFCAAMVEHAGADRASLLLLDEDEQRLIPMGDARDSESEQVRGLRGPLGTITVNGSPAIALALHEGRPVTQEPNADGGRLLVQPLATDERKLGVVLLEWHTPAPPNRLSSSTATILEIIAGLASTALQHAQLFERVARSGMQLTALHDVAVAINNETDLGATLARIAESVRLVTGARVARIGLADPSGQTYTNVACAGVGAPPAGSRAPLSDSVGAWVLLHARMAWVPDTAAGVSEPAEAAAWIHDHSAGSAVAVPIPARRGADCGAAPVLGFLTLRHPQPYFLERSCLPILERFATEAGLAVENHRELDMREAMAEQLRVQAATDPLTGLANRTAVLQRLTTSLRRAASARPATALAVLFLDLDRFKTVNDSLGHAAGDELLIAVAQRLCEAVRTMDVVGRLGGDEFVVVLDGLPRDAAAAEAHLVAERILLALAVPVVIRGRALNVSASIGLTVGNGYDRDAEDLLRDADVAMYRAKAGGKAQVVVFDPSMSVGGLLDLESDLRQALDEQSLHVHYQPVVDLRSGRTVGVEALARWYHPTLGLVSPTEFVALAEETGLVRRLDEWVLETALREIGQVRRHYPELELNANLSALQLHERALPERIAEVLASTGFTPEALTLEITETAAMWDPARTLESLAALRALGLGVVLDDFGTGYSNFGYLKRLPLRGIKIDRTFVEHMATDQQDTAIVSALITLSDALRLTVTAEGVETAEQQRLLLELGCRRAQGFLFSAALPLGQLTRRLAEDAGATAMQRRTH